MAIIVNCPIHGNVGHNSAGECAYCRLEKEAEALKEWEARSLEERLRDLYLRIKALERGPQLF